MPRNNFPTLFDEINEDAVRKLVSVRNKLGYTRPKFAEKIGITIPMLDAYETLRVRIPFCVYRTCEKMFNFTYGEEEN